MIKQECIGIPDMILLLMIFLFKKIKIKAEIVLSPGGAYFHELVACSGVQRTLPSALLVHHPQRPEGVQPASHRQGSPQNSRLRTCSLLLRATASPTHPQGSELYCTVVYQLFRVSCICKNHYVYSSILKNCVFLRIFPEFQFTHYKPKFSRFFDDIRFLLFAHHMLL